MARRLNQKQQTFLKLYLGDDPTTGGNATQSYKAAYGSTCSERSIQSMGSKMLNHPLVKDRIARAEVKAAKEIDWGVKRVLQESVRLYDRCMGDDTFPVEYTATNKDTGIVTAETRQGTSFNPAGARAALELIGRNVGIQAFTETVEVNHTHYLEQQLSKRAKVIEGRARVIDDSARVQPGSARVRSDSAGANGSTPASQPTGSA